MKTIVKWGGWMVLAAALGWTVGCDDSSGGALKLELGNMREQSVSANKSKDYKFTTTTNGIYRIDYDTVSTGDRTTLKLVADESYTCNSPGNPDANACVSDNNLEAATTYEFTLQEQSGVDTTFRVGASVGP